MLGVTLEWMEIRDFPAAPMPRPNSGRSALASSFVAALELAKRGRSGNSTRRAPLPPCASAASRKVRPGDGGRIRTARGRHARTGGGSNAVRCRGADDHRGRLAAHLGGLESSRRGGARPLASAGNSTICRARWCIWSRRGKRWHFETAPDLAHLLRREKEQVRRLSLAAGDRGAGDHRLSRTGQPCGDRNRSAGVQTSAGTLDGADGRRAGSGWRAAARFLPGRPVIYATTARIPRPFRPRIAPRACRASTNLRAAGAARSGGRGDGSGNALPIRMTRTKMIEVEAVHVPDRYGPPPFLQPHRRDPNRRVVGRSREGSPIPRGKRTTKTRDVSPHEYRYLA